MHIGLLSVSMNVYSTRRLLEEARIAGHSIEQIDHSQCSVVLGDGRPRLYLREENITHAFDAIIPWIGLKVTQLGAAIVKQFEMNGVFSFAKALSIVRSRNKVRALQLLSRKGIPIPKTLFSINPENIDQQLALLGGAPVIIKIQEGTQGMGVILAESEKSALSILETLYRMDAKILIQEYIGDSKGEDIRTVVVGQKIVASMKRTCEAGDFRSNVHRGATTAPIALSPQERQMALNASPGLQGIEAATGVNVAGEIIRFIEKNARSKRK